MIFFIIPFGKNWEKFAKGIMKNVIPGQSYKRYCKTHFRKIANREKCNFVFFWRFFDHKNQILKYFNLQLAEYM